MTNPCLECGACCEDIIFGDTSPRAQNMLRAKNYPVNLVPVGNGKFGLEIVGKCPNLGDDNLCSMFADGNEGKRPIDCILLQPSPYPYDRCAQHRARKGLPPLEEI